MQVIEDLQFIPVAKTKAAIPKDWNKVKKRYPELKNCPMIGVVCGALSGGLEAIDFDLKYDLTGKLYEHYRKLIEEAQPDLYNKMVIQTTMSGGFHWLYRCSVVGKNEKLANRHSIEEERQQTFTKTYNKQIAKGTNPNEANKIAQDSFDTDKIRVLIETRGEGGFVVCFPSDGYNLIHGDFQSISEITPEERDLLLSTARKFNKVVEEYKPKTYIPPKTSNASELSPFDDYNERGDVVQLLLNHGWTFAGQKGNKTHLLRAGASSSATSGNWDSALKRFSVFTTSTVFEPNKAYLPYAVYAIMEHNGDYQEARKSLYEKGFGDREEEKRELKTRTPSRISAHVIAAEDDLPFLVRPEEVKDYLYKAQNGLFEMGKTTGFDSLDKYFRFKEGNLVMINGHDNVGKTVVMMYLHMLAAILHNWHWLYYVAENSYGSVFKRLMEFYWGLPIAQMTTMQYEIAYKFVQKHFKLIRIDEETYNYRDLINMSKRVFSKYKVNLNSSDYWNTFIDPVNALTVDVPPHSKKSTHEWKYDSLTEIRSFLKAQGCGMYMNNHVVTEALRKTDEDGYPVAPQKADTESGGMFANKADDFLTVHRVAQHPTQWMFTELHVRKIKETETGGQQTPLDKPVLLKMGFPQNVMFFEVDRMTGNESCPIRKYHRFKDENSVRTLAF